jgi:hypothetical protein
LEEPELDPKEAFFSRGMAEEKGALQSARSWIVEHKLRAVGTSSPILFLVPPPKAFRRSFSSCPAVR